MLVFVVLHCLPAPGSFVFLPLEDGKSNLKCTLCGNQSSRRDNMRNHIESAHFPGHFSYNCNHCDSTFKSKNALCLHVSRKHRDAQWYISVDLDAFRNWEYKWYSKLNSIFKTHYKRHMVELQRFTPYIACVEWKLSWCHCVEWAPSKGAGQAMQKLCKESHE